MPTMALQPDQGQTEALDHVRGPLLVTGPPGTGKTYVLRERFARLVEAGWEIEQRTGAAVVHRNRATVAGMLGQRFRHGAGAGWLEREHPGALPARRWPGLALWSARRAVAGFVALARGDRDSAISGLLDGPAVWAFELGRLVPNRPLRRRA